MIDLQLKETLDILLRLRSTIDVVSQENDSARFLEILPDNYFRSIEISVSVPNEDDFPPGWEMNQSGFFLEQFVCLPKEISSIHPICPVVTTLT
jgi:hypothetical protein